MQTHHVRLESEVFSSYRCQRAADSLDIDVKKKSIHELKIECDLETAFNVGLIVGASGSGKTSLARKIFGDDCFSVELDQTKSILDQLPPSWSYDDCASALAGIGLTSVPQWIKPLYALSNGQRARCEAVYLMTKEKEMTVIDEWTSVVDRTVAKVMSHCVQKFARKAQKKIVLLSCHYDVIEWLNPDWIIDCNNATYTDRRSLRLDRTEKLTFDIKRVDRSSWRYFSKYHYLSDRLPGGIIELYGLFHGQNQIGFQCFANYVPRVLGKPLKMHSNRTVIHPDYAGLGLGIKLIDLCSLDMLKRHGKSIEVWAKFSSTPIYKSMQRNKNWKLMSVIRTLGKMKAGNIERATISTNSGFRENVKTYSFKFIGRN